MQKKGSIYFGLIIMCGYSSHIIAMDWLTAIGAGAKSYASVAGQYVTGVGKGTLDAGYKLIGIAAQEVVDMKQQAQAAVDKLKEKSAAVALVVSAGTLYKVLSAKMGNSIPKLEKALSEFKSKPGLTVKAGKIKDVIGALESSVQDLFLTLLSIESLADDAAAYKLVDPDTVSHYRELTMLYSTYLAILFKFLKESSPDLLKYVDKINVITSEK